VGGLSRAGAARLMISLGRNVSPRPPLRALGQPLTQSQTIYPWPNAHPAPTFHQRQATMSPKEIIEKAIADSIVMVFSKTYCPYCVKAKNALNQVIAPSSYAVMEVRRDLGRLPCTSSAGSEAHNCPPLPLCHAAGKPA
jgi:hypothetical protein